MGVPCVNAGEKIHRRAGVKMHHGFCQSASWRTPLFSLINEPDLRLTLALLALFEPVALTVHFEDVDVVSQPVEQRAG
jgi:hypothetical protein